MVFGNGVKNIQATAYNGARTVFNHSWWDNKALSYNCMSTNDIKS